MLQAPIVVGPARKSFIAAAVHGESPLPPERRLPAESRLGGTIAACVIAAQQGAAMVRVHDVEAVKQALAVSDTTQHGLAASGGTHVG
jgi:dihydropteroate synthase